MAEVIETLHFNGLTHEKYTLVNGIKEGLYQKWYSNSQIYIQVNYIAGKKEGLYEEWYQTGQKAVQSKYVDDKKEGLYQVWYLNGDKMVECNYLDDKREGLYKEWSKYDNMYREYNYVAGKREGFGYCYDKDNSLIETTYCRFNHEYNFKNYAKRESEKYKESLMITFWHPDRVDRLARSYNIESMEYMDILDQ